MESDPEKGWEWRGLFQDCQAYRELRLALFRSANFLDGLCILTVYLKQANVLVCDEKNPAAIIIRSSHFEMWHVSLANYSSSSSCSSSSSSSSSRAVVIAVVVVVIA